MSRHHAFVIEAEAEEGIAAAQAWAERELGLTAERNPDVIVLRHGLFSVEDARRAAELAALAPFAGKHKVLVITADRAYHEAQNALLKLFEEPPEGVYLFLVLPTLGGLLPTLLSRAQTLAPSVESRKSRTIPGIAQEFLEASKEKRSALIKRLASGKGDDERRAARDSAIKIMNGIEAAAYGAFSRGEHGAVVALLDDIARLRGHLYDRSAPLRMILEHLSLVIPKNLL